MKIICQRLTRRCQEALCAGLLFAAMAGTTVAGEVTVVTSFPKEVTDAYKRAFEARYPSIRIQIVNKNTNAAVIFIERTLSGSRPDVFWASAPDAFEVMARNNLFESIPDVRNPDAPDQIGSYPINDPGQRYYGQALSGYGIMWNERYLIAHHLPRPVEWDDLTKPIYFGHLALSSPSWSGTTHLMVESILQSAGWNSGWSQLLQIAANSAAITERSFGVPEGVNAGRYGIGMVIDFFAFVGKRNGFPVDFTYPAITNFVPASIGLVRGARNAMDARKFIAFTLSNEGQKLLLDPRISRMPVVPYELLQGKVAAGYPSLPDAAAKNPSHFDAGLAQERIRLVTSMFDQSITFPIKELRAAAREIYAVEEKMVGRNNAEAAELLAKARLLTFSPVVSNENLQDPALRKIFFGRTEERAIGEVQRHDMIVFERQWNARARAAYLEAKKLALRAEAKLTQ